MKTMKWRNRRLPTIANIRHAIENKSGSEALEMVYSTAALCALILVAMTILFYALQMNAVAYASKRVARYIEVSGTANPTDLNVLLHQLLPNADEINAKIEYTASGLLPNTNYHNISQHKIQLRERFTVVVSADYTVTMLTPGSGDTMQLRFPIRVSVNGQSEVYWK